MISIEKSVLIWIGAFEWECVLVFYVYFMISTSAKNLYETNKRHTDFRVVYDLICIKTNMSIDCQMKVKP